MTFLIIYLIGYIVAYFGQKKFLNDASIHWTKRDRAVALVIASTSWVGIVIVAAAYFISEKVKDTPAKW